MSLIDVLVSDAEQLVEHELPSISQLRGVVAALAQRLEVIAPQLVLDASRPVRPEPAPVAPAPSIGTPIVVTAPAAAPVVAAPAVAPVVAPPVVEAPAPTVASPLVADAPALAAPDAAPAKTLAELQVELATADMARAQLEAQIASASSQAPAVVSAG